MNAHSILAQINQITFNTMNSIRFFLKNKNPWMLFKVIDTGKDVYQNGIPCRVFSLEVRFPVSKTFFNTAKADLPPVVLREELSPIDQYLVTEHIKEVVRTALREGLEFTHNLGRGVSTYIDALKLIDNSDAPREIKVRVKRAMMALMKDDYRDRTSYLSIDLDIMTVEVCLMGRITRKELTSDGGVTVWQEEVKEALMEALEYQLKETATC